MGKDIKYVSYIRRPGCREVKRENAECFTNVKCENIKDEESFSDRAYFENLEDFETNYKVFLSAPEQYLEERNIKSARGGYKDPDANSFLYYKHLAIFLNKQENIIFENNVNNYQDIKNRIVYTYEAVKDKNGLAIKVYDKDKCVFCLKSDQLAFSAPIYDSKSGWDRHPYGRYIADCGTNKDDIDNKVKNVCKWIYITRTIGCGFLWPKEKNNNPPFNNVRGNRPYNDRVDLTLEIIKNYYIEKKEFIKNSNNMYVWLDHFGTGEAGWKRYIDFHCFKDVFVNEKYDIKKMEIKDQGTCWEEVLNDLSESVDRRSKKMLEIINRKE